MINKYGESQARSKPEANALWFKVKEAAWKDRCLIDLKGKFTEPGKTELADRLIKKGKEIETHLEKQEKNQITMVKTLDKIKARMDKLESEIDETVVIMQSINNSQLTIGF
jgi:phage shock protein A